MNGKKAKAIRRHVKNYIGNGCTGKEPTTYTSTSHQPKQVFNPMTGKTQLVTPIQIFVADKFRSMVKETKRSYLNIKRQA